MKQYFLLALNLLFFFSLASFQALIPTFLFLIVSYLGLRWIQLFPFKYQLALTSTALLLGFVYLKKYTFLHDVTPFLPFNYTVVGLSYILFRVLQLHIDSAGKCLKQDISFISFINFTCFFPCFLSGPIYRYDDFQQQSAQSTPPLDQAQALELLKRLIQGFIKVHLISTLLYQVFSYSSDKLMTQHSEPIVQWLGYCISAPCYAIFLYFNFSGYTDIAIATGRLFGFTVPENFNKPFESQCMLDFWSKWHITLSEWLKTYVFNPVVKCLMHQWSNPKLAPYFGVVAYFFTFLLMGLWHGTTWTYFIYGLFLGGTAAANKLYQIAITKRLGKKQYKKLCSQKLYLLSTQSLTISTFSIALTAFWISELPTPNTLIATILSSWVALWLSGTCILYVIQQAPKIQRLSPFTQTAWLGVQLFFLSYLFLANANNAPEFVYQAF